MIIGLELFKMGYTLTAILVLSTFTPLIGLWVLAARVHRGIDVYAAIIAAIASSAISEKLSETIDLLLMEKTLESTLQHRSSHRVEEPKQTQDDDKRK